jgi:dCTP deaminase
VLLNANEIADLLHMGIVVGADPENINQTSLDITLAQEILIESPANGPTIEYGKKEAMRTLSIKMHPDFGHVLTPGEFVLAASKEIFNLPLNISAEYKLKSSMGRIGLEHLNAGWCDPGWNGSCLTLELVNLSRWHNIRIRPGDRIGQVVFFRHAPVTESQSYAQRGRYNGDRVVTGMKGT